MENNFRPYRRHRRSGTILTAFVFIAVGIILLCVNTGWMPVEYKRIFISWQMLLIFIGVVKFFRQHYFAGSAAILVGGFFLMPVINRIDPTFFSFIPADFVQLYWPVFLILLGAFFILRWMFPSSTMFSHSRRYSHRHERFSRDDASVSGGYVEINNLFSGSEQIVLDPEFKGGEVNSVFGGTKLDLRKTNLPEGITTLDLNLVFGGLELYIPADWTVEVKVDFILGGFEDRRYGVQNLDPSRKLIIKGSCILGGGELKN